MGAYPTIRDKKVSDGAGSGSFTSSITGLVSGAIYHIRAYATNSAGTSYGNMVTVMVTNNLSWFVNNDILTISGTGAMLNYNLITPPNSWGYADFPWPKTIKQVIIKDGVSSIGNYAFDRCDKLYSVTIPNSVTTIGEDAFNYCVELTSITIPNSVTTIGDNAFFMCNKITSITIPNSVTSIVERAFAHCSGLTSLTISNSVKSIGEASFISCSGLTSLTIPNSVISIGLAAFEGCSGLTTLTIPNSVVIIGKDAFWGCSGLTSLTIPISVTTIGDDAFRDCSALKDIYSLRSTPATCKDTIFIGINTTTCTLHVPVGSKANYKAADYWKDFTNIVEDAQ